MFCEALSDKSAKRIANKQIFTVAGESLIGTIHRYIALVRVQNKDSLISLLIIVSEQMLFGHD